MFNVIFQIAKAKDPDNVIVDSRMFFSINKKKEWFSDPFVQLLLDKVDRVKVIKDFVLEDENGNAIPPEYLSTGSKTVICIYEFPEKVFNITQVGDNALAFVSVLSKHRDITGLCYRFLPYDQMIDVDFYKDYQKFKIGNIVEFDTINRKWLEEESIND